MPLICSIQIRVVGLQISAWVPKDRSELLVVSQSSQRISLGPQTPKILSRHALLTSWPAFLAAKKKRDIGGGGGGGV